MARPRLELHEELCQVLRSRNCYYESDPTNLKMKYPCYRYQLERIRGEYADNLMYTNMKLYTVTAIYYDPDDDLPERTLQHFPYCTFDRNYIQDGLIHAVVSLYY